MRDTKTLSRTKIPILGDLPVLGFLFRDSREQMHKTNLLLILTPHVIRDQQDLRLVFERKMHERQQFLDRYFVFTSDWEPPVDFSRTNGLVEDIRQAYASIEERERIERESQPREVQTHEAGAPLELAGALRKGSGGGGGGAAAPARPTKKGTTERPKTNPRTPAKPKQSQRVRPRKKVSTENPEPPLRVERVARSMEDVSADPSTEAAAAPGPPVTVDRVE